MSEKRYSGIVSLYRAVFIHNRSVLKYTGCHCVSDATKEKNQRLETCLLTVRENQVNETQEQTEARIISLQLSH